MIKIENFEVVGMEHAIRGMRNPKNSWEKSDSFMCEPGVEQECPDNCTFKLSEDGCPLKVDDSLYVAGPNDLTLMKKLAAGGPVHAKYRRMIAVYLDITAPLYWWKEFDTYKVGTVANSCSTMHKIHEKEFMLEDFSCEHLMDSDDATKYGVWIDYGSEYSDAPLGVLEYLVNGLNVCRERFLKAKENGADGHTLKRYWWQMIQLLPSSYNQKRTIMLNYEVLTGIYKSRKDHKLDEWREFCKWIEQLPYSEIITGVRDVDMSKIRQKNYGTKEE